jgi:hypothetical protein
VGSIPTGGIGIARSRSPTPPPHGCASSAKIGSGKPSTLVDYESALRAHLLPAFGDRELESIMPEEIERWRRSLTGLSNRSKNKLLIQLHGIFRRARTVWGLAANPLARVEKHPMRPSGDTPVFSPEEVWELVRATASEQDGALFLRPPRAMSQPRTDARPVIRARRPRSDCHCLSTLVAIVANCLCRRRATRRPAHGDRVHPTAPSRTIGFAIGIASSRSVGTIALERMRSSRRGRGWAEPHR